MRTGGDRFVVDDLLDPEINVRYGSWYLRELTRPLRRRPYRARRVSRGSGQRRPLARNGVGIQFPETRAYVDRVLDAERVYAEPTRTSSALGAASATGRRLARPAGRAPSADRSRRARPRRAARRRRGRAARSRMRAGTTMPSTTTPRKRPISSLGDVGAELARGLGILIHALLRSRAASGAIVFQRSRNASSDLQPAAELEVDGEPVGILLGHRRAAAPRSRPSANSAWNRSLSSAASARKSSCLDGNQLKIAPRERPISSSRRTTVAPS